MRGLVASGRRPQCVRKWSSSIVHETGLFPSLLGPRGGRLPGLFRRSTIGTFQHRRFKTGAPSSGGQSAGFIGPSRPISSITREADKFFKVKPTLGTFIAFKTAALAVGSVAFVVGGLYHWNSREGPSPNEVDNTLVIELLECEEGETRKGPSSLHSRTLIARMPKSIEDLQKVPHGVLNILITSLVVTATTVVAWSRMQWQWSRRHFMGHVNFSLNSYRSKSNTLTYRTLFERPLEDLLYKNKAAVKVVTTASRKTVPGQPLLIVDPAENWFLTNAVLNAISEKAFCGHMRADAAQHYQPNWYVFGITCEKDEGVWNKKIRVMLIQQQLLEDLPNMAVPDFEESDSRGVGSIRWKTLQTMATMWRSQCQGHPGVLARVDLPLPGLGAEGAMSHPGLSKESTE